MSFDLGVSKNKSKSSQQANLPLWLEQGWRGAINDATTLSQQPFQSYGGPMTSDAGLSSIRQAQGFATKAANASLPGYQAFTDLGGGGYQAHTDAKASTVDPAGLPKVAAGSFTDKNVNAYMNPYLSSVVQTTLADIDRQNEVANAKARTGAVAAGAYGGSRATLLEAENNRNYADVAAKTGAGLRAEGFNQAANLIQQDLNRAYNADTFNAGLGAQAAFANQNARNQFGLYNAQAENAARQYNAGLNFQAASQNAAAENTARQFNSTMGLQNAQLGLQGAQLLGNLGRMENDIGLNNLALPYQEFLRGQSWAPDMLNMRLAALGMSPHNNDKKGTGSFFEFGAKGNYGKSSNGG